jgi:uncharacterized protein
MLAFDVHHLLTEPVGTILEFSIDTGPERLGDDVEVAFLRGEVQLLRMDYGILAQGTIATQVETQCVRCLAPISYPLTIRLAEQFAHDPQAMDQDEDPVFPIVGRRMIDLALPLREHVLLDLPLRLLCRPDCRGLCSQCGANLNEVQCDCSQEEIDPRLAILRDLL